MLAVNHAARTAGLRPGRTVADAQATVPALQLAASDPEGDRVLLEHLADSCLCYTPWSAVDDWVDGGQPGGGLWLDISGCAHLTGGEDALLRDLLVRLARYGFKARAAVADAPGAAWAWARFGDAGRPVLPGGADRRCLAVLPLPALRLLPATVDGLLRLGVKTIGDLEALPRAGLASRFGQTAGLRLDQALGRQSEPISPPADAGAAPGLPALRRADRAVRGCGGGGRPDARDFVPNLGTAETWRAAAGFRRLSARCHQAAA